MVTMFRPRGPVSTILDEIVCDDFQQRWCACRAVEATIWATGLNACQTPVERATWQAQYASHLWQLYQTWHYAQKKDPLIGPGAQASQGVLTH